MLVGNNQQVNQNPQNPVQENPQEGFLNRSRNRLNGAISKVKKIKNSVPGQKIVEAAKEAAIENSAEAIGSIAVSGVLKDQVANLPSTIASWTPSIVSENLPSSVQAMSSSLAEIPPVVAEYIPSTRGVGEYLGGEALGRSLPILGYIPAYFTGKKVYQITDKLLEGSSNLKRKAIASLSSAVAGFVTVKVLYMPLSELGRAIGGSIGGEAGEFAGAVAGGFIAIKLVGSAEKLIGGKLNRTYGAKSFYVYIGDKISSIDLRRSNLLEDSSFVKPTYDLVSGIVLFNALILQPFSRQQELGFFVFL